jgi:hypothetical protein
MVEPSNQELAELPHVSREYIKDLESIVSILMRSLEKILAEDRGGWFGTEAERALGSCK